MSNSINWNQVAQDLRISGTTAADVQTEFNLSRAPTDLDDLWKLAAEEHPQFLMGKMYSCISQGIFSITPQAAYDAMIIAARKADHNSWVLARNVKWKIEAAKPIEETRKLKSPLLHLATYGCDADVELSRVKEFARLLTVSWVRDEHSDEELQAAYFAHPEDVGKCDRQSQAIIKGAIFEQMPVTTRLFWSVLDAKNLLAFYLCGHNMTSYQHLLHAREIG